MGSARSDTEERSATTPPPQVPVTGRLAPNPASKALLWKEKGKENSYSPGIAMRICIVGVNAHPRLNIRDDIFAI